MPLTATIRPPRLVIRRLDGIDEVGDVWTESELPSQLDTPPDCSSTFVLLRTGPRYALYREVAKP